MVRPRFPVLSVARPWSTWLAHGIKDIENRTWKTQYRGPMWIHAAQSWDDDALDFAEEVEEHLGGYIFPRFEDPPGSGVTRDHGSWHPEDHPTGIVGLVELADVALHKGRGACLCGPWAVYDQHHWRIANPRPLVEPIEARGRLGLWWPEPDLEAHLRAARFREVIRA